jgi:hypothetical protein
MGEHESQAGRSRVRGCQRSGNPSLRGGTDPTADPGATERGGAAPLPGSRSSTSAKPDFRATVGRRLSEERELGPQVLSLISAEAPSGALPPKAGSDPSPTDGPVSQVDQRDEFVAELAHAMQAAMSAAHRRVVKELERRRRAHVDALRGRAAEADGRVRDWADQQIARIDRWVEAETQRIRLEGEVRIAAYQSELETRLAQSRTEVDRAIEVLDAAVGDHRAAIDAFLLQIAAESDPAKIARLVDSLPPVPSLDEIGQEPAATEGSAAETGNEGLIGVMGPRAGPANSPPVSGAEIRTPGATSAVDAVLATAAESPGSGDGPHAG